MKKTILCAFAAFALLSSCKKSKDQVCDLSEASIAGTYKITAVSVNGVPLSASDLANFLGNACEADDTYTLNTDKTFTYNDAGIVCSPSGSYKGANWSLTGNTIFFDGESENVDSYDCTSMTLSEPFQGGKISITYTRQ
jgi:Lipocalin-like domain